MKSVRILALGVLGVTLEDIYHISSVDSTENRGRLVGLQKQARQKFEALVSEYGLKADSNDMDRRNLYSVLSQVLKELEAVKLGNEVQDVCESDIDSTGWHKFAQKQGYQKYRTHVVYGDPAARFAKMKV